MHSNLHYEMYESERADRARRAHRVVVPLRRRHPPPLRGRVAYAAAWLAHRLDSESARRAA